VLCAQMSVRCLLACDIVYDVLLILCAPHARAWLYLVAKVFEDGYPILLALEDWLRSYFNLASASGMKKWVASISWPGGLILSVQDMFDHVMSAEWRAQQRMALVVAESPATVEAFHSFLHEYYQGEAAGVSEGDVAAVVAGLHQTPHPNLAPLHNLCVLMARYCCLCDMLTDGPTILKNGKLYFADTVTECPFEPSAQCLAKMDHGSWDSRCMGDGVSAMSAH